MKVAFVPLAFLVFMLPLPYLVSAQITLKLQLISSELGVAIIRLFSIPVYLEGNVIDLGAYKLGVVSAPRARQRSLRDRYCRRTLPAVAPR